MYLINSLSVETWIFAKIYSPEKKNTRIASFGVEWKILLCKKSTKNTNNLTAKKELEHLGI
jgi:hypothetical protein